MLIEELTRETSAPTPLKQTKKSAAKHYSQEEMDLAKREARAEAFRDYKKILIDNQKYAHLTQIFPNRP